MGRRRDHQKRRTLDDRIRAMKLREAKRLDDKVRALRARAILVEAEANKLRAEAERGAHEPDLEG